ncbi:MAG: flagellar assembly protein FliW [Clostridiaceae bacterium]
MINEIIVKKDEKSYEDKIITFCKGIPGFINLKKFVLEEIEDNEVFYLLKSIEDEKVAFIVVSPFFVDKSYNVNLDESLIDSLRIANESQVLILNTVTLHSDMKKITTNLVAPLVINIQERVGEQIVFDDETTYQIKTPIFKE